MTVTRITPLARQRARRLRNAMTPIERKLWKQLREFKRLGFHFRRQAPIGPYIADFAELSRKLIVELDGDTHGDPQAIDQDARRDGFLKQHGFGILRISNSEVARNCIGVAEYLLSEAKSDG